MGEITLARRSAIHLAEATSPENRWYCSQHFGYNVTSIEILLKYYIERAAATFYKRHPELANQVQPTQQANQSQQAPQELAMAG